MQLGPGRSASFRFLRGQFYDNRSVGLLCRGVHRSPSRTCTPFPCGKLNLRAVRAQAHAREGSWSHGRSLWGAYIELREYPVRSMTIGGRKNRLFIELLHCQWHGFYGWLGRGCYGAVPWDGLTVCRRLVRSGVAWEGVGKQTRLIRPNASQNPPPLWASIFAEYDTQPNTSRKPRQTRIQSPRTTLPQDGVQRKSGLPQNARATTISLLTVTFFRLNFRPNSADSGDFAH